MAARAVMKGTDVNRSFAIAALLLVGCTRAQGAAWMPRLVLRGGVAQRGADRPTGGVERWDWRLEGDLSWRLDRPGPPPIAPATPKVTAPGSTTGALPCLDAAICAWERRARARASSPRGGEP